MKIRDCTIKISIIKAISLLLFFTIVFAAVWDFKLQLQHILQTEAGPVLFKTVDINLPVLQLVIKLGAAALMSALLIKWGTYRRNKEVRRTDEAAGLLVKHNIADSGEDAFRLSDERYLVAIKASHAALFEIDLETKEFLHFENAESIIGISVGQIFKEMNTYAKGTFKEYETAVKARFFHPDDFDVIGASFEMVFKGCPTHLEARMRGRTEAMSGAK